LSRDSYFVQDDGVLPFGYESVVKVFSLAGLSMQVHYRTILCMLANQSSPSLSTGLLLLLIAQRQDGIHPHRPTGWNVAGRKRECRKQCNYDGERQWIRCADAIDQTSEEPA
jgi:hypothetical protein